MSGKLESFLHRLEARPHSFSALLIVTGFVGVGRAMQEYLFFGEKLTAAIGISMAIAYFHLAVALTVLLSFTTGHDWKRLQNAVYLGIFLGLFPPFIDLAISGFNGAVFYRFYLSEDFRQIPWHFYAPAIGAPAGETAVVWLSIFLTSSYAFWKTQSWWRMLATLVLAYGYFMLHFALVPITTIYWLRLGAAAFGKSSIVHAAEIAPAFFPFWYLALSVILYIALRPQLRQIFAQRTLHLVPFVLLVVAGGKFTREISVQVMLAGLAAFLLAYSIALQNDYFDARAGEHKKKVEWCDVEFFLIITAGFLLWMVQLNQLAILPLLLIFALGILYNFPYFRLKKYFPGAQKVEGAGALMFYLTGVMVFDRSHLRPSILITGLLIFGGWSVVVSWKDLKDIRRDKRLGYKNLYTFLMDLGHSLSRAHKISSVIGLACIAVPIIYALATKQFLAAVVIAFLGFLPLCALTYFPTLRNWFRTVLAMFCIILTECMFLLKI